MTQTPADHPKTSPESSELFHLIVDNVKDYAIFMTDAEGSVMSWNPGVEQLLGYTESEILGQPISVIFTREDQAANAHLREMETAVRTGRSEDKRWHVRRDGSRFWANGTVIPLKNADDTVRGFAKVMRDDTAGKMSEEKLAESSRRASNIFESMTDAFMALDHEWRFTHVNHNFELVTGRQREELIGKSFWEEIPETTGSTFEKHYRRAAREQIPIAFEEYYPPLDLWVEVRAYPTPDGLAIYFHDINERKQAQALLQKSEEKYRALFDSIDEGFCTCQVFFDENGRPIDYRILELNPQFEKLTGISAAAALSGQTIRELVPNLEESWIEIYGRVAQTGEPARFENGSDALERWFDVYAFRTGATEERKVAILFTNITARKQSEKTLREAEERYRALVEATATTVWHANSEGALTFVGDAWTQVSGQSVEEILKWGWLEAIHPDDRERTIDVWQNALRDKTLYSTEFRVLTLSGKYQWFAVNAVPIFDSEGSVREWVGSNIDVSARKQAEEERAESLKLLEAERSRLAYIFEQAPAFVTILRGADHTFELTNPAYLQLIGHRNVIGKRVREALPEVKEQGFLELLDRVYQSGEPFIGNEMAIELQYAPNSPLEKRFINFVYQPIFGADRKSSGIFVHGVDVTGQVEARQQAENANRMKDEFLATLSHELRTPLNAILGWSQILQTGGLSTPETHKALSTIERNARAQNQLIDDILDVSRIITGKLRLDVQAVNLSNVITAATEAARPAAEAKNIRLQVLLDPAAGLISGDPDRLQQVVWNLLSNAVKFTPKGGRVQVRLERVNSHVEIVVSDTGKGIEAEFLPFVFDRFRQSDGSMTRRHGGLGLGLAIVRQIIELHGGTVTVASDGAEKGATFTVHLPLLPLRREIENDDLGRVHPTSDIGAPRKHSPELQHLQVLLVDDEQDSRDLLNHVLVSRGAIVTTAASAAQALELVKRERFNVIISDIGMPQEDGFSLIKKIRALPDEEGGAVPAIALTAYARAEDRVQALRSGFQMHVAKPVEPDELVVAVANLAGRMRTPN